MNLEIDNFNPTVAELHELAEKYKELTIDGLDDKDGYERVHKARMELVRTRLEITKTGKALRDDANKFAKAVIAKEKELVGLIEPVEKELKAKQDEIDEKRERARRFSLLPERMEKLLEIEEVVSTDELLGMSNDQFLSFYNERKEAWLFRKEQELAEERLRVEQEANRIENEKREAEAAKKREAEIELVRKEAAKKAEQETKERLARQAREKVEQEAKEQASLERKKKYQSFLAEHGAIQWMNGGAQGIEFMIQKNGEEVRLYKFVGSIKI